VNALATLSGADVAFNVSPQLRHCSSQTTQFIYIEIL
jgi:hypothetical protein